MYCKLVNITYLDGSNYVRPSFNMADFKHQVLRNSQPRPNDDCGTRFLNDVFHATMLFEFPLITNPDGVNILRLARSCFNAIFFT